MKAFWQRARMRLGFWILGRDAFRIWMGLWLVRERAQQAITQDGRVELAACEPLAEVLYRPVPGTWSFTITRNH